LPAEVIITAQCKIVNSFIKKIIDW